MGTWYYLDGNGHRQGPITGEALVGLFNAGGIHQGTLAWRDGLSDWSPLSRFLDELGLPAPVTPPAIPVAATQVMDSRYTAPEPPSGATKSYPGQPAPVGIGNVVYAGFWRRYLALIVDQFVLVIPLLALTIGVGLMLGLFEKSEQELGIMIQAIYLVAYLMLAPLYYALQESSRHQATLGKRALGIKVTDLVGNRLTFTHALGRWFAASLSYITMYIGFLMAAFTTRKQALHDKVANTLVTDRWAFTAHPERQKQGLSGCLVAILIILVAGIPVLAILAAIALPAYQDYTIKAKVAQAIATAAPLKLAVTDFQTKNGSCPVNGEGSIQPPMAYATANVTSIDTGVMQEGGRCGIQIILRNISGSNVDGKHIWLELDASNGAWHCSSEVEDRYLPSSCRG